MSLQIKHLHCNTCNKQVSTGFIPIETETPDKGLIIRAYIECPECIEKKSNDIHEMCRNTGCYLNNEGGDKLDNEENK